MRFLIANFILFLWSCSSWTAESIAIHSDAKDATEREVTVYFNNDSWFLMRVQTVNNRGWIRNSYKIYLEIPAGTWGEFRLVKKQDGYYYRFKKTVEIDQKKVVVNDDVPVNEVEIANQGKSVVTGFYPKTLDLSQCKEDGVKFCYFKFFGRKSAPYQFQFSGRQEKDLEDFMPFVYEFKNDETEIGDILATFKNASYLVKHGQIRKFYIENIDDLKSLQIKYLWNSMRYDANKDSPIKNDLLRLKLLLNTKDCNENDNSFLPIYTFSISYKMNYELQTKNRCVPVKSFGSAHHLNEQLTKFEKSSISEMFQLVPAIENTENFLTDIKSLENEIIGEHRLSYFFTAMRNLVKKSSGANKQFIAIPVIGDQGKPNTFGKIALSIKDQDNLENVFFGVSAGDNVYQYGPSITENGWASKLSEHFNQPLAQLFEKKAIPFFMALGNHDIGKVNMYLAQGDFKKDSLDRAKAQISYTTEDLAKQWKIGGAIKQSEESLFYMPGNYYSKLETKNDVKTFIVVLDTNYYPNSLGGSPAEYANDNLHDDRLKGEGKQKEWLIEQLQSDNAKNADYIIVVGHHALRSVAKHGNHVPYAWFPISNDEKKFAQTLRDLLLPLFAKYGVHFYLAGHDHVLSTERFEHDNGFVTVQLLSGAAAKSDAKNFIPEWLANSGNTTWLNNVTFKSGSSLDNEGTLNNVLDLVYGYFMLTLEKDYFAVEAFGVDVESGKTKRILHPNWQEKSTL